MGPRRNPPLLLSNGGSKVCGSWGPISTEPAVGTLVWGHFKGGPLGRARRRLRPQAGTEPRGWGPGCMCAVEQRGLSAPGHGAQWEQRRGLWGILELAVDTCQVPGLQRPRALTLPATVGFLHVPPGGRSRRQQTQGGGRHPGVGWGGKRQSSSQRSFYLGQVQSLDFYN